MLNLDYKIKGLVFHELWFTSKVPLNNRTLLGLYCYRDSRMSIEHPLLKREEKYTLVNDISLEKDEIFSKFKSNVRNEIRKCEKIENFTYALDATNKEQFLDFYREFAEAKSLPIIQKKSIDKYGDNLIYLSGEVDGKLTNMQVYIVDNNGEIVRLLHSISVLHNIDSPTLRAKIGWINRYLHWHTMIYFRDKGFKVFDWGGYNNGVDAGLSGIDKFKASFGGEKIKLFDYYSYPYFIAKTIHERFL